MVWLSPAAFRQQMPCSFVIEKDEVAVGLVSLGNLDTSARKVEIGLAIDPAAGPARSKIAVPALAEAFDYVFDYLGLNRVFCLCLSGRKDLEHLLTAWKFRFEGTLRDNVFFAGRFHDESVFGLCRADFEEARKKFEGIARG